MDISVVGAGRVGTAIGVLLARAGHRIVAVSGREPTWARAAAFLPGVPFVDVSEAARAGEAVLIGLPDDRIAPSVTALADAEAFRAGSFVMHLSGASGLDLLEPARAAGAHVLVFHPLQTFADVAGAIERIPGSTVAVTASDPESDALGRRLAGDMHATPFSLRDEDRLLYHAAAVFASNDLIVLSSVAEELLHEIGLPDPIEALMPLQRASLDNVARLGAAAALTGPAVRGDVHTIDRHLTALRERAPRTVAAYVALCRLAVELAMRSGRLSPADGRDVEDALARWS